MAVDIGAGLHDQSRAAQAAVDDFINVVAVELPADELIAVVRRGNEGEGAVGALLDLLRRYGSRAFAADDVGSSGPVLGDRLGSLRLEDRVCMDIGAGLHGYRRVSQTAVDDLINIAVIDLPTDELIAFGRGSNKGESAVGRLVDLIGSYRRGAFAALDVGIAVPVILPPCNGLDPDSQPKIGINGKVAEEGIICVVRVEAIAVEALIGPFPVDEIVPRGTGRERAQIAGFVEVEYVGPCRAFAVRADENRTVAAAQTPDKRELVAAGVLCRLDIYEIIEVMGTGVGNGESVGVGGAGSKDLIVVVGNNGGNALFVVVAQVEECDIGICRPDLFQITGQETEVVCVHTVGRLNQGIGVYNGRRYDKAGRRSIDPVML